MKKIILSLLTMVLALTMLVPTAWSMNHMRSRQPYGGYCRGLKWGWYGASRTINTVDEARTVLEEFVKETELVVGEIEDKEIFYKADIYDNEGNRIDILIVDKRSSRIRSVY